MAEYYIYIVGRDFNMMWERQNSKKSFSLILGLIRQSGEFWKLWECVVCNAKASNMYFKLLKKKKICPDVFGKIPTLHVSSGRNKCYVLNAKYGI